MIITHWVCLTNAYGRREELSWEKLFAGFSRPIQWDRAKDDLPGWSPGTFRNDHRAIKDAEFIYALGLDDDKGTHLDRVVQLWGEFYGFVHTTWRSTPGFHRHRTILPLSRPVTGAEYKRIWRWANQRAEENGQTLDQNTRDPSRLWFVPAVGGPEHHFETRILMGRVLDVDLILLGDPFEGIDKAQAGPQKPRGYQALMTELGDDGKGFNGVIPGAISSYVTAGGRDFEWLKEDIRRRIEAAPKSPQRAEEDIERYCSDEYLDQCIESACTKRVFKCSETGNAERFAHQHHQIVRYVPEWSEWIIYDGRRWVRDTGDILIERLAKMTLCSMLTGAGAEEDDDTRKMLVGWAKACDSRRGLSNMVALARSEPLIAIAPTALDPDPLLLNCENGTIDLRTGMLRGHRPEDLITKICPVVFDPWATHPMLARYLHEATGGDQELEGYLARWAGYCASGLTVEKAFAFLHGPPDTAKSTFVDMLRAALGTYAVMASPDTWLRQSVVGGNRGDLARLLGARLVTTSEFKEGAVFDEATIKGITGGDALTVAAKYEREIEFTPTVKIMLAANVAPAIRAGDEGMWARCHRIPFTHVLTGEKKDPLVRLLLTDAKVCGPAVLAWIVKGFLAWQRNRLAQPAAVLASTAAYRTENDPVAQFVAEYCYRHPDAWVAKGELRDAFDEWRQESGAACPNIREFKKRVMALGCSEATDASRSHRLWKGLGLLKTSDRPCADDRPAHERALSDIRPSGFRPKKY